MPPTDLRILVNRQRDLMYRARHGILPEEHTELASISAEIDRRHEYLTDCTGPTHTFTPGIEGDCGWDCPTCGYGCSGHDGDEPSDCGGIMVAPDTEDAPPVRQLRAEVKRYRAMWSRDHAQLWEAQRDAMVARNQLADRAKKMAADPEAFASVAFAYTNDRQSVTTTTYRAHGVTMPMLAHYLRTFAAELDAEADSVEIDAARTAQDAQVMAARLADWAEWSERLTARIPDDYVMPSPHAAAGWSVLESWIDQITAQSECVTENVRQWVHDHAYEADDIVLGSPVGLGLTEEQLPSLWQLLDAAVPDWRLSVAVPDNPPCDHAEPAACRTRNGCPTESS